MSTMKAAVFLAKQQIKIRETARPEPRAGEHRPVRGDCEALGAAARQRGTGRPAPILLGENHHGIARGHVHGRIVAPRTFGRA